MSNGNRTKKSQKQFTTTTITREDSYSNNRRRYIKIGGFSMKIHCNGVFTDI